MKTKLTILKHQKTTTHKVGDIVGLLSHPYKCVDMPDGGHVVTDISETGIAKVSVMLDGRLDELAFYDTELIRL